MQQQKTPRLNQTISYQNRNHPSNQEKNQEKTNEI
jgi:hypothetical protein